MNRVLYDDQCPFCVFQMKVLTWCDWFHIAKLVPLSSPEAKEAAPNVDAEMLREAMHVVTKCGKTYRGARCVRFLAMRIPLLVPLALFMWLPGMIYIAEWVYKKVAKNRLIISRVFGCKDACAILPARKREGDKLA